MSFHNLLESALKGSLFEDISRTSARSCVAILCTERGEILMIRRAQNDSDYWSGHMAFPGGREETADINLLATAIRETLEELSIQLDGSCQLLGRLQDLTHPKLSVSAYVFAVKTPIDPIPNYEVAAVHWVPLAAFDQVENWKEHTVSYQNVDRVLPIVWVGELDIWGISLHFIEQLRSKLNAVEAPLDPLAAVSAQPGQLL